MNQTSYARVARFARGDAVDAYLLVEGANYKQNRAGKPFLQLTLRDQSGRIKALQWETDRRTYQSIHINDIIHVKGRVEEYQGGRQILVDSIEAVNPPGVSWEAFLPPSSADPRQLLAELRKEIEAVRRPELRELLLSFIADREISELLATCPAGKTLHHAYRGGLLDHIVSIIGLGRALATRWPDMDGDLLVAGAILHDLGKIRELRSDRGIDYTDAGQLVGHVALALDLLNDKMAKLPAFPPELRTELEHLIVSHHGKVEYGALREPMTAEAIALHFLDNLDARLSAYFALARDDQESPYGESWTNVNPMFGTRLFRPERIRSRKGTGSSPAG